MIFANRLIICHKRHIPINQLTQVDEVYTTHIFTLLITKPFDKNSTCAFCKVVLCLETGSSHGHRWWLVQRYLLEGSIWDIQMIQLCRILMLKVKLTSVLTVKLTRISLSLVYLSWPCLLSPKHLYNHFVHRLKAWLFLSARQTKMLVNKLPKTKYAIYSLFQYKNTFSYEGLAPRLVLKQRSRIGFDCSLSKYYISNRIIQQLKV